MRDGVNMIIVMWVCLIVANVQMYLTDGILKYFGFIPLLICWILFLIGFIQKQLKESSE